MPPLHNEDIIRRLNASALKPVNRIRVEISLMKDNRRLRRRTAGKSSSRIVSRTFLAPTLKTLLLDRHLYPAMPIRAILLNGVRFTVPQPTSVRRTHQ
jgi:hypothetical protein